MLLLNTCCINVCINVCSIQTSRETVLIWTWYIGVDLHFSLVLFILNVRLRYINIFNAYFFQFLLLETIFELDFVHVVQIEHSFYWENWFAVEFSALRFLTLAMLYEQLYTLFYQTSALFFQRKFICLEGKKFEKSHIFIISVGKKEITNTLPSFTQTFIVAKRSSCDNPFQELQMFITVLAVFQLCFKLDLHGAMRLAFFFLWI